MLNVDFTLLNFKFMEKNQKIIKSSLLNCIVHNISYSVFHCSFTYIFFSHCFNVPVCIMYYVVVCIPHVNLFTGVAPPIFQQEAEAVTAVYKVCIHKSHIFSHYQKSAMIVVFHG